MHYFFNQVIRPYINESNYCSICEIGAEDGKHTDELLPMDKLTLTVIDPCINFNLYEKYDKFQKQGKLKLYADLSLNVLAQLTDVFDCILVDGDHNWYTVYNELKTIEERGLLKQGGTIFLHDVCWPYARRDMYYLPETIPPEYLHPYATKKRMIRGQSELVDDQDKRSPHHNAIHEGVPRNGVLTAVEDFLKEYGEQYSFFYIDKQYGLGFLLKSKNILSNSAFTKYYLKHSLKEQVKHKLSPVYKFFKATVKN